MLVDGIVNIMTVHRKVVKVHPGIRRTVARTNSIGPIIMNTNEELERAFSELREGTFIKNG